MTTIYVNPATGADANTGLSEGAAVESLAGAMGKLYTFVSSTFDYDLFVDLNQDYDDTIVLLGGITVMPRCIRVHSVHGTSGAKTRKLTIVGRSMAQLSIPDFAAPEGSMALYMSNYFYNGSGGIYSTTTITLELHNVIINHTNTTFTKIAGVSHGPAAGDAGYGGGHAVKFHNCSIQNMGDAIVEFVLTDSSACSAEFVNCCIGASNVEANLILLTVTGGGSVDTTVSRCAIGSAEIQVRGALLIPSSENSQIGVGSFLPYLRDVFSPDFSEWTDDSSYVDGRPAISTSAIAILSGPSCRVKSPVLDVGVLLTIGPKYVAATEVTDDPGSNHVVDSTPLTTTRTMEWRYSETSFVTGDASPAWTTIDRAGLDLGYGRYFQFRVTLTTVGA